MICFLFGHNWGEWSEWLLSGYIATQWRKCKKCGEKQVESGMYRYPSDEYDKK
jgi:hypothetical protein